MPAGVETLGVVTASPFVVRPATWMLSLNADEMVLKLVPALFRE
jgi:hypothetical protein